MHNVSDGLASVGVIVARTLIILYDLYVADLIVTLAISAFILYQGFTLMSPSINIPVAGTPEGVEIDDVVAVHHLHVWQLNDQHAALEAQIVVTHESLGACEHIKQAIKDRLAHDFGIGHATLNTEPSMATPAMVGQDAAIVPPH